MSRTTDSSAIADTRHAEKHSHIIDVLIRERAVKLCQKPLWPVYRVLLNKFLGYRKAVSMADDLYPMRGLGPMAYTSRELKLQIEVKGKEHMPHEGACILAINHPTGIADGIAIFDVIKDIRPDLQIYANRDACRISKGFNDVVIPVEWVEERKTREQSRETLKRTKQAFAEGRPLVIFPSGRLAYMDENKVLQEREWMSTVAALPRKYKLPIIPVYMTARNSWVYYWFNNVNEELRNMTLFRELLNKGKQPFTITIAPPISPDDLPTDNDEATKLMQDYVTQGIKEAISFEDFKAGWTG